MGKLNSVADKEKRTKRQINDLAVFGGEPVFSHIRSTSNLATPDMDAFFSYAKTSFDNRRLTNNGPMVQELERRLAELHQVDHCVAVCSGFWSVALGAYCLALDGRNEVVMPSLTYRRMADIMAWLGLVPHFCDVTPKTTGVTAATVEPCINENTALILGVHPIVHLADVDSLAQLAQERKIPLLFDSVEAVYASHRGRMIGSFGNAECFSMHASKLVNAFEAGYVTTNDADLAARLRIVRGFGFSGQDRIEEFGLNAKLNELHAAVALASLDDLENHLERNRARYNAYEDGLKAVPSLTLVEYNKADRRAYKNILVKLTETWPIAREDTLKILHAENMLARPYYSPALHTKPGHYPTIHGDLPATEVLAEQYLLLPCGDFVDVEDVEAIVLLLRFLQDMGEQINRASECGSPC